MKQWLERENKHYCKLLNIKPIPILLYTLADINKVDNDLSRHKLHKKDGFSIFDDKERHIYLNIRSHSKASDLIDTLVHELTHIKNPNMSHGREFQHKVNEAIMKKWQIIIIVLTNVKQCLTLHILNVLYVAVR